MAGVNDDFDLGLKVFRPDGEALGFLPHPRDLQVAYPVNDIPSLQFSYSKDSPEAKWFTDTTTGWEVAVMLWIPARGAWIEPPNSRFLVLQWEDDVTDDTNLIRFTCPGYAWLLSKQLIRKGKKDDALNAVEADKKKKYDTAVQAHNSAKGKMSGTLSSVRSTLKFKGGVYYQSSFPSKVKSGKSMVKPKYKSILWHGGRQKFYWYNNQKWLLITHAAAANQVATAKTNYSNVVSSRNAMLAAKEAYDKAKYNAREATKNGKRPMVGTTAGWAISRHIAESRSYGAGRLARLVRSFNGTYGSGTNSQGKLYRKWTQRFNIDLTIGMSILDLLRELSEMGKCEWQMRGRTLDVYRPGDFATDVSNRVALHLGEDLTDAPDRATRHEFASYLLVRGEGNLSFGMRHTGSHASIGWGAWEKAVSASGASKVADAKKLALAEAKSSLKRIKMESTRGLIVRVNGPRPMYDYLPGHYVRAYGTGGTMDRVRVMQITLTREDGGHVSGNLVLADRFYDRAINFTRSLSKTLGGYESTIGGGTVPALPAPPKSVLAEARTAPSAVGASALTAINPASGEATTKLMIAWSPAGETSIEPVSQAEEDAPDETDEVNEAIAEY